MPLQLRSTISISVRFLITLQPSPYISIHFSKNLHKKDPKQPIL